MKKIIILAVVIINTCLSAIAQNKEVSTLRIGDCKVFMGLSDLVTMTTQKIKLPTEKNDYNGNNSLIINGEKLEITIGENYYDEKNKEKYIVTSIATKSKSFKTKSGIGIGNTRDELIDAYRNYSNFEVFQGYTDEGEKDPSKSYFILNDTDAGTSISFEMINNKIVEIAVHIQEGC